MNAGTLSGGGAVSDVVWQALIAAALAIYMEWSRRQVAEKVAQVESTLISTTAEKKAQSDAILVKLDDNTAKTETVVEQTNGLTQMLKAEVASLKAQLRESRAHEAAPSPPVKRIEDVT